MDRRKISIIFLSFLWIDIIQGDVCTSTECIHASATMLESIDKDADPCHDFYDFACGNFIQENHPPDENVAVDTFTRLKEDVDAKVYALLNGANDDAANGTLKLSQELFKTCLDRNRRTEDEDVKALNNIIEELGGMPLLKGDAWEGEQWTLEKTITQIRKVLGFRTDKLFDIASFIINLENANNNPSIRPSATFFSLRNAYFGYISNLVTFLGATGEPSDRANELNHLLDFQYELSMINHQLQQLSRSGDVKELPDELLRKMLYFQWLDDFHPSLMKNVQVEKADGIERSSLLKEMSQLLNKTSARTLSNFVILRVVDYVASQSTSDIGDIYITFQRSIDGRLDREQRWRECVDMLSNSLPFAIGAAYVDKYLKADTKASVLEMLNNIKAEFTAMLSDAKWIDESTREKLLNKLKSLVPLIADPDDGFNQSAINQFYESVKIDKSKYLRTLFQLRIIDADNKFRQTYTSTALDSSNNWLKYLPPTSVAAFYSTSDNTIRLSAGILQNAVYDETKINYLQYGRLGFIIAHEISHIVNQIINDANSLSEKARDELTAKKQCLIEQYNGFEEPELSMNVDGKRTLIENFADTIGLTLAYRAYITRNEKFASQRLNLIGLDYTWDQLFWLSAAQTWCGVYRQEELTRKIVSDSYAPERFRAIGPLQNSPDFAKDFNCSPSSPMNRKNKCIIW